MLTILVYTDNWNGTSFHLLEGDYSDQDGLPKHKSVLLDERITKKLNLGESDTRNNPESYGYSNKITPELALSLIQRGAKIACLQDDNFTPAYINSYLKCHHGKSADVITESQKELSGYLGSY